MPTPARPLTPPTPSHNLLHSISHSFVAPEDRVEYLAFFIEMHFAAGKQRPVPTSVRVRQLRTADL